MAFGGISLKVHHHPDRLVLLDCDPFPEYGPAHLLFPKEIWQSAGLLNYLIPLPWALFSHKHRTPDSPLQTAQLYGSLKPFRVSPRPVRPLRIDHRDLPFGLCFLKYLDSFAHHFPPAYTAMMFDEWIKWKGGEWPERKIYLGYYQSYISLPR